MDVVRFHFDPICPWCYQTSRWAKRVEQLGEIELDWGLFSLEVVNLKDGADPRELQARSGPALRTATLIRAAEGRRRDRTLLHRARQEDLGAVAARAGHGDRGARCARRGRSRCRVVR